MSELKCFSLCVILTFRQELSHYSSYSLPQSRPLRPARWFVGLCQFLLDCQLRGGGTVLPVPSPGQHPLRSPFQCRGTHVRRWKGISIHNGRRRRAGGHFSKRLWFSGEVVYWEMNRFKFVCLSYDLIAYRRF